MAIYNAKLINIDPIEVRRYAGLRKAENFNEQNIIDACEEAQLLINIRGIWNMYDYNPANQTVLSEPPVVIEGKSIGKHLEKCDKVICIAVTVGEEIEQEITKRFDKGEYVSSVLLDAAATTAVEQAADAMEKTIEQQVSRNSYSMRWRYSPGYGDWPLTQQPELFRLAHAEEIGMQLSSAMMLIPRKSITAIIGLVKKNVDKKIEAVHNCAACDKIDCPSRKVDD